MIDTGVSPPVKQPDPASYANGAARTGKPPESGFSDTLSSVSQKDQQSADNAGEHTGTPQAEPEETLDGLPHEHELAAKEAADGKPVVTKPRIDIRFTLPRDGGAAADTSAGEAAKNAAVEQEITDLAAAKAGTKSRGGRPEIKLGHTSDLSGRANVGGHHTTGEKSDDATDGAEPGDDLSQMLSMLSTGIDAVQGATAKGDGMGKGQGQPQSGDADGSAKDALTGVHAAIGVHAKAGDAPDGGNTDSEMPLDDGNGKSFKLMRADGKGEARMALDIREAGDAKAERVKGEGGPTVTLLEERRYLAPASDTNAGKITAAMLGDSQWVESMRAHQAADVDAQTSSAGKVVNTLKIQMTPIELGTVTASLKLAGDTLSVHLTVDNAAALKKLNEDHEDIVKALKSHGFAVDQVQVSLSPASRGDQTPSDGQQQGSQQGQQQNWQGSASGGQRQASGDRGFTNAMGNGNEQNVAAPTAQGDAGGPRTGGVYL